MHFLSTNRHETWCLTKLQSKLGTLHHLLHREHIPAIISLRIQAKCDDIIRAVMMSSIGHVRPTVMTSSIGPRYCIYMYMYVYINCTYTVHTVRVKKTAVQRKTHSRSTSVQLPFNSRATLVCSPRIPQCPFLAPVQWALTRS